ncbi:MAG: 50S ribosomal protein L28 [SAR324 cluster bacterium]|nr:50S ribosomal protein L28 [SAR324 cluster bacterium]MCZ6531776.1 50S ribosomal protein L28 [SAR324 cluster bacterium]MCZ6556408.1 50S ribosomal protein L28 [SAR324 cluster bacterium]MCZ6629143.1 50S ribosomal protein L28 [SAR324 cluster bacterium]MCZ6645271.1 50S ribosomal protein L28 [SAR324 cluster bacterium]
MAKVCQITGKRGQKGNRVSHANNKSKHTFLPNLQKKRIFVPELKRYVTVKLSTHGLKIVDKKGAFKVLKEAGLI